MKIFVFVCRHQIKEKVLVWWLKMYGDDWQLYYGCFGVVILLGSFRLYMKYRYTKTNYQ